MDKGWPRLASAGPPPMRIQEEAGFLGPQADTGKELGSERSDGINGPHVPPAEIQSRGGMPQHPHRQM